MKLLSLVRHAKSDRHTELADHERPLNSRGERAAPEMARRWRRHGLVPDRLCASTAVRAATTARLFAAEFGVASGDVRTDARLYLASPGDLLATIHETPTEIRHLMVFGHNPGISALARMLCPDLPLAELPTAAVCTIRSRAGSWRRFETASLELVACDWPKSGG
jgi:phosphohistidine phosphatase